jgi:hypothetical protein
MERTMNRGEHEDHPLPGSFHPYLHEALHERRPVEIEDAHKASTLNGSSIEPLDPVPERCFQTSLSASRLAPGD